MAFEDLKGVHRMIWDAAPFEEIEGLIADMHDAMVERVRPAPDQRWLDLGCGTGAITTRAAGAGASVTGIDLSPNMIRTATRRAQEDGLEIRYETGDCENLRFEDGAFDVVSSSVGMMFAPDHAATAGEIARVCAPGGRICVTTWRPDGGVGRFFEFMRSYMPPPFEGAGDPMDWGREDYAGKLFGEAFELEFEELDTPLEIGSGEEYWDLFTRAFGPVSLIAGSIDDDAREEMHRSFVEWAERDRDGDMIRQSRTYMLTTGTRRWP
jgi:SAM-dependent methyltransferase